MIEVAINFFAAVFEPDFVDYLVVEFERSVVVFQTFEDVLSAVVQAAEMGVFVVAFVASVDGAVAFVVVAVVGYVVVDAFAVRYWWEKS